MRTKKELRAQYKSLRKQITEAERESASLAIAERFINFLAEDPKIQTIHVFLPIAKQREPDTFLIIKKLLEEKKEVYSSVLLPSGEMQSIRLNSASIFEEGDLGIPIPKELEFSDKAMIQLVLVPLLVYDTHGNRIGYGKGYYDQFLASLKNDVVKVGLSYFAPEEIIENEAHDIPLDYCITPQSLYSFEK